MRASPVCLLVLSASLVAQAGAPRVVSLTPAHRDAEVDASAVSELVVVFDRPMNTRGWSFCGGGPTFPRIPEGKRPRWKNTKTCVLPVVLAPDHTYVLSLNAPSATNFRSAAGVALSPVSWSFSTLPEKLPDQRRQRRENQRAFSALEETLASRYSYYDHRGVDWPKVFRKNAKSIARSKTTRSWTAAVARMLEPSGDLHLFLRFDGDAFPTGRRAVDSLFRQRVLDRYLTNVKPLGKHALVAETEDGYGYLMIGTWTRQLEIGAIEKALARMGTYKGIVVDVRPNSGGDESIASRVAKWFVKGTKVYAKNRYRVRKGKRGFGPILDRKITGNPSSRRLDKPVVVLTSPYVMSSGEAFVLMMRQAPDCTVIGQRTYGSSGNPKPHELPNGVTIVVPSWQGLRLDGTCFENEGLKPDVEVDVDLAELGRKDPILERGLAYLRKKR